MVQPAVWSWEIANAVLAGERKTLEDRLENAAKQVGLAISSRMLKDVHKRLLTRAAQKRD